MKKFLLTFAAACAVTAASATATELVEKWGASVENAWQADSKVWKAGVAIDASGNVIATGVYTEDITVAGTALEAVGSSSYIVKYNAEGVAQWAVGLVGSATVTALDTDASGNIYVAGTLADVVTFGTTSGTPVEKEGLTDEDGAASISQNASFVAKYATDGQLVKVVTFVPKPFPSLAETGMYYPSYEEDLYFRINGLSVQDSKLYVSAVYTNLTEYDGVKFEASYNDPWFGVWFTQLKAGSVFTLNDNLADCMSVARVGVNGNLATDEGEYSLSDLSFTVNNGNVYIAATGNGPLQIKATDQQTVTAEASEYNYILTIVNNGTVSTPVTASCPDAGFKTYYNPAYLTVKDGVLYVVGNESFTLEDGATYSDRIFVMTAAASNLANLEKNVSDHVDGDITYYDVTSAAFVDSEIIVTALGYYNKTVGDNRNGDFADSSKTYYIDGNTVKNAAFINAYAVAVNGTDMALASIGATGATFAVFGEDDNAGITDIAIDAADAPAEYFNLQGVRVANPENGLYIVRQGDKVTKQVIRR